MKMLEKLKYEDIIAAMSASFFIFELRNNLQRLGFFIVSVNSSQTSTVCTVCRIVCVDIVYMGLYMRSCVHGVIYAGLCTWGYICEVVYMEVCMRCCVCRVVYMEVCMQGCVRGVAAGRGQANIT